MKSRALVFIVMVFFSCYSPSEQLIDVGKDGDISFDILLNDTNINENPPQIFSISPDSGFTDGGIEITINGKNFKNGLKVFFGEVESLVKSLLGGSTIIVRNPPHKEGRVDVIVINPDGKSAVLKNGFEYKKKEEPVKECVYKRCEIRPTIFKYDSSKAGFSVSTVELAAQFTNWGENRIAMNDEGINGDEVAGDGIFSVAVILGSGEYEYKYILNKNQWISDPDNENVEPIFKNSVIKVKDGCQPEVESQAPKNGDIIKSSDVKIEAKYFLNGRDIDKSGTYFIVDGVKYNAEFLNDDIVMANIKLSDGPHWYYVVIRDMECNRFVSPSVYFIVKTSKATPISNAGYTQIVEVGNKVFLDGTLSEDPHQIGIEEYKWEIITAPESVNLNDEYATDPAGYNNDPNAIPQKVRSVVSFVPNKEGYYRFSLKVSNQDGDGNSDETDVYVLTKSGSELKPLIVSEIRAEGSDVLIDASNSLGANTNSLKYLWIEDIKNPEKFNLDDSFTQRITIKKDGTYFFYLVVNDGVSNSEVKRFFVYKRGQILRAQDFSQSAEWFKSSNIYEIFVRKFMDGNSDGIGDLKGLKEKISYLKGLGVDTIWLMPIFRSNDKDHGYHTIDYYTIESDYGDNEEFLSLIQEAHKNGIKVVLDMVINHTSRRHPFFIQALNMNPYFRDFYIWFENNSPNLYDKYGYGREMGGSRLTLENGWAEIPDINYSNPVIRKYIYDMLKYWMDPNGDGDFSDGVDGFRIDHVTGPSHKVWMNLRRFAKSVNPDIVLIAEVFRDFDNNNQGYGIKDYYNGEFDAAFTFPYYWTINSIVNGGNRPDALEGLRADLRRKFSKGVTHSFFIQNHDIPYKSTALNEYGGYNEKGIAKQISAASLMFLFPNSPQILYGEELGITEYRGFAPWENYRDDNILYSFYKSMYALRKELGISVDSDLYVIQNSQPDYVYSFVVKSNGKKVLGVMNMKNTFIDTVSLNIGAIRENNCGALIYDSIIGEEKKEVEANYDYLFIGPLLPYEGRFYNVNEKGSGTLVKVKFYLNTSSKSSEISKGKWAFISGDIIQLGNWVPNQVRMIKANSDASYFETYICNNTQIEYKYLIDYGAIERWDGVEFSGQNRKVTVVGDSKNEMEISDIFGVR